MSKFIPASAVTFEKYQQQLRAVHGLKLGTHIKFPHAENGPFILRKDKFDALTPEQLASIQAQLPMPQPTVVQKLKRGFKKLIKGVKS